MSVWVELDEQGKDWFMKVVEGLVKHPEAANILRVRGQLDLQIVIVADKSDRGVFTDQVCLALEELLRAKTGAFPVVYLDGAPHPKAAEALKYAADKL